MSFFGRLANRVLGSGQFDRLARSTEHHFSALLQAHDNQSQMLHEKLSALVLALDNQSDLLNQKLSALVQALDNQSELLNRKLDDIRSHGATALELQRAELVMQRDVTDAMHELSGSIKGTKSPPAAAVNPAREDTRPALT
jgi:hypothetical protein